MTATIEATAPAAVLAAPAAPRPSIARLTAVEVRKLTDTRAGRWLLAIIVLGCVAMATVQLLFNEPEQRRFEEFFLGSLLPIGILLPVLGILTVTSEWSQRTAQTTFALVPLRGRVLAAKLLAGAVATVASVGASLIIAAVANVIAMGTGGDGGWGIAAIGIGNATVAQLLNVIMGLAFGMALLNTPLAIVAFFVVPTVWSILGGLVDVLATAAEWLDFGVTMMPLFSGETLTAQQWAQVGTTTLVWVVLPLVVGTVRVLRSEVS